MEKAKNSKLWVEKGYTLFAEEGLDGIQVERLARMVARNKSGFYHYFSDLEGFCEELIKLHEQKTDDFVKDVLGAKTLDPDFFLVLSKHAYMVMFQVQLTRNKRSFLFFEASKEVDEKVNFAVYRMWSDYLGVHNNADLATRYFSLIRDMFYTRISFQNFNYPFLQSIAVEAKGLFNQMVQHKPQPQTSQESYLN